MRRARVALALLATVTALTVVATVTGPRSAAQQQILARIDLQATMQASADEVVPGDAIVYTVVVRNHGPSGALAVKVQNALPGALTPFSVSVSGPVQLGTDTPRGECVLGTGVVSCDVGPMLENDAVQVKIVVTVAEDACDLGVGALVNTATARNEEPPENLWVDTDPSNDAASVTTPLGCPPPPPPPPSPPRLLVALDDSGAATAPRGTVTYTFSVGNGGGSDGLVGDVEVALPGGATLLPGGPCRLVSSRAGAARCGLNATVPPGGLATLQLAIAVPADPPPILWACAGIAGTGASCSGNRPCPNGLCDVEPTPVQR